MRNYRITFKKETGNISFFIDSKSNSIVNHIQGLDKLQFQLVNKDPLFFNYTNLLKLKDNESYFFQNTLNNTLQNNEFVDSSDSVIVCHKRFNLSLPPEEVAIEIKTDQGNTVLSTSSNRIENLPIDASSLDTGQYQIWLNDKLNQHIFITCEKIFDQSIGILSIDINSLISGTKEVKSLVLNFNARSAYFTYQVVVPSTRKIEVKELAVSSPNGEVYLGPKEQTIIGNQQAQVFSSKTPNKLQNQPNKFPQMKLIYANNFSNRNNQIDRNLPYPELDGLQKYYSGNGQEGHVLTTIVYV